MRVTVNLDDDVLRAARELAVERRQALGQALSGLIRRGLWLDGRGDRIRNSVPLLPPRQGAGPVTAEAVQRILSEG